MEWIRNIFIVLEIYIILLIAGTRGLEITDFKLDASGYDNHYEMNINHDELMAIDCLTDAGNGETEVVNVDKTKSIDRFLDSAGVLSSPTVVCFNPTSDMGNASAESIYAGDTLDWFFVKDAGLSHYKELEAPVVNDVTVQTFLPSGEDIDIQVTFLHSGEQVTFSDLSKGDYGVVLKASFFVEAGMYILEINATNPYATFVVNLAIIVVQEIVLDDNSLNQYNTTNPNYVMAGNPLKIESVVKKNDAIFYLFYFNKGINQTVNLFGGSCDANDVDIVFSHIINVTGKIFLQWQLSNFISDAYALTDFISYYGVNDFNISVNEPIALYSTQLVFTIAINPTALLAMGNVNCELQYDKSNAEKAYVTFDFTNDTFDELQNTSVSLPHYYTAGWYTANVVCYNELAGEINDQNITHLDIDINVIVENPVENIVLLHNSTNILQHPWSKPLMFIVELYNDTVLPIYNVSCVIQYGDTGVEPVIEGDLTPFSNLNYSQRLPGADAEITVYVHCSNLLTSKTLVKTVYVYFDCWKTQAFFNDVYKNMSTSMIAYTNENVLLKAAVWLTFNCEPPIETWWDFYKVEDNGTETKFFEYIPPVPSIVYTITENAMRDGLYRVFLTCYYPQFKRTPKLKDDFYLRFLLPNVIPVITDGNVEIKVLQKKIDQQFIIDSSKSSDPAGQLSHIQGIPLTRRWDCITGEDLEISELLGYLMDGNLPVATNQDCSELLSTYDAESYEIAASRLNLDQMYLFTLRLSRGDRSAQKSVIVTARPLDPLPVFIRCLQNCHPGSTNVEKLIVDDLHLNIELETNQDISGAIYNWTLEKFENGNFVDLTGDIAKTQSTGFHITKEWLQGHFKKDEMTKFQITCTVKLSGFHVSSDYKQYVINLPPYGGDCLIANNDTAIAGITILCFNCSNWKDEGVNEERDPDNDKGGALKYVAIQKFLDIDGNVISNISGIARTPTGNLDQCFQLEKLPNTDLNYTRVEVHILDPLTEPTAIVDFDIAVTNPLPAVLTTDNGGLIDALMKDNEEILLQYSSLNDFQGTADIVASIASVISVQVKRPPPAVAKDLLGANSIFTDLNKDGTSSLVDDAMSQIQEPVADEMTLKLQETNQFLVETLKAVMEKLNQSVDRDVYSNRQLVSAVIQISKGPEENIANETMHQILVFFDDIIASMENLDNDNPTARKLEEEASIMIHTVTALVVPDVASSMHTKSSLVEIRQLSNDLQQYASSDLLSFKERADFTEDDRVFFNTINQKQIAYVVSTKIATVRMINGIKKKYENDLLNNYALSDGSFVTIGGNDNTTMYVDMTTDSAQNLASKEVEFTKLNVSVPGLVDVTGKARILVSDMMSILNIDNSGRFAHMTSTQKRLIINTTGEVTGTVSLTEEIPAVDYQTFELNFEPDDASQLMYYTMYVRSADDDIRIRILQDTGDREVTMFNVYVNIDEDVTILDYLSTADCKSPDWTATFSSQFLKENNFESGNINFAVKPNFKEDSATSRKRRAVNTGNKNGTKTTFNLATTTSACTIWDDVSETWKSDVCQGVWNPDDNKFTCNCPARREMTFTNSFYVAPNTIDYSTVFLKFSVHDQAAVIAALAIVFIIYVLVVIWSRWQDRKDVLKWGVTPLADNFPDDSYFYVVKVFTGMRVGAGTRSRVSFVIGGEEIDTGIRVLSDGVRKDMPTGSVMNFLMATNTCLGDLEYLRIWHDNSGSGNHASWYLSKIELHDVQLKESFLFQAERWLAIEKDDGLLESVFPVSKSENYNVFKNRFVLNAKENLAESHMWISVAYRPQASKFSRVQRASCALVFIVLSMIANAVYFQSVNEENYDLPTEIIVGPFRFSLQQIYISFLTALIVTPVTLVVIYMFKKSNISIKNTDKTRLNKKEKAKRYKIPLFDDWLERERLQSLELETHLVEKGNPKIEGFKLPWMFYYMSWLTVIVTVVTCVFYLLLFSAEWGKQKSEEWLTTFILSFFESVFCFDPIKVAFMALTFAILFRSAKQSQADIDRKNILRNYSSRLKNRSGGARKPAPPLDEEKLKSAREWRQMELQMRKAVRDVILNIFHAWILFSIAYSNLDSQSYRLHEEIKGNILEPDSQPQFSSISTIDEFFSWLNDTAIVNMFPEEDYSGGRLPWRVRQFINDGSNFRVGPPRLRQMRTKKKEPCSIPYIESEDCLKKYSESTEDDGNYCIGWSDGPCDRKEDAYYLSSSAWKYTSAFDIWGLPIAGVYTTYGGGGYIAELSVNRDVSRRIAQEMYDNVWIDRQTRGVFFEFTLYCLNSNIFVYSVFLIEFPETGGALPYSMIFPLRVYQHVGPTGQYTLACEIIFLLYLIGFTVVAIISLYQQRKAYFSQPWQVYDLVFIAFSYTAVIFYFVRIVIINDSLDVFLENKKAFVNFYHVAIWNLIFVVMLGVLCFMTTLRLMNSLGYNKRIRKTVQVFRNAGRDLISFAIFFICYYFFYAFFGYLLFGSKLEPYKNIVKTLETLFLSLLGATTLSELEESDPVMAKIYFISFIMFMVYFVMTMFMAILCEAIDEINSEAYVDKDGEVVDFMLAKLKDMFMFGGRAQKIPDKAPEDDECDELEMKFRDGRPLPDYFTNRTVLEYIRDSMFDALQDYRNATGSTTEMSTVTKSKTSFDKF